MLKKVPRKGIDTRNRWQRIFDARYNAAPVNLTVKQFRYRCLTPLDNLIRLSKTYGFSGKHPRTGELIDFQTTDVTNYAKFPRVPYKRVRNRQAQIFRAEYNPETQALQVKVMPKIKRTGCWASVWFTNSDKRK